MLALSATKIRTLLAASDKASNSTERGRALEKTLAHIFSTCPGVRHFKNNALNASGSSEVDVCFWNSRARGSLDFLPEILVAECKNTGKRIGSASVRIFLSKLTEMKLEFGSFGRSKRSHRQSQKPSCGT